MPTNAATAQPSESMTIGFRDVFERHFDYVERTLRLLGIRPNDLEDVAHDVFLHVYRHLGEYDPTRPIKPWLYAFTFRIARDFRKLARHRESVSSDLSENVDQAPHPETLAMQRQLQAVALRCLDALDPDERGLFVAATLEELTAPEIAEALSIPVNTVYSRLRRARSKFENAARRMGTPVRVP